jgi:hypothetical protein
MKNGTTQTQMRSLTRNLNRLSDDNTQPVRARLLYREALELVYQAEDAVKRAVRCEYDQVYVDAP